MPTQPMRPAGLRADGPDAPPDAPRRPTAWSGPTAFAPFVFGSQSAAGAAARRGNALCAASAEPWHADPPFAKERQHREEEKQERRDLC